MSYRLEVGRLKLISMNPNRGTTRLSSSSVALGRGLSFLSCPSSGTYLCFRLHSSILKSSHVRVFPLAFTLLNSQHSGTILLRFFIWLSEILTMPLFCKILPSSEGLSFSLCCLKKLGCNHTGMPDYSKIISPCQNHTHSNLNSSSSPHSPLPCTLRFWELEYRNHWETVFLSTRDDVAINKDQGLESVKGKKKKTQQSQESSLLTPAVQTASKGTQESSSFPLFHSLSLQ